MGREEERSRSQVHIKSHRHLADAHHQQIQMKAWKHASASSTGSSLEPHISVHAQIIPYQIIGMYGISYLLLLQRSGKKTIYG